LSRLSRRGISCRMRVNESKPAYAVASWDITLTPGFYTDLDHMCLIILRASFAREDPPDTGTSIVGIPLIETAIYDSRRHEANGNPCFAAAIWNDERQRQHREPY
jgi:hypothetical protein